jgi:hypothetical protein
MVLVGDVVAPVAIGFLDAATVEGVKATKLQSQVGSCRLHRLEHMRGLVGGDVELPTKLAHIGDAMRAGESHAGLDFARGAKRDALRC